MPLRSLLSHISIQLQDTFYPLLSRFPSIKFESVAKMCMPTNVITLIIMAHVEEDHSLPSSQLNPRTHVQDQTEY